MPADYRRIHRLLRLLTLIQSGPYDVERLARECRVAERTIYRDLDVFKALGIPISFDEEALAYRIRRDFFMPPLDLTLEESLALVALGEEIAGREQIPMTRAAACAIVKIRSQLPGRIRDAIERADPHVAIDLARAGPHEGIRDVYALVRAAIATRRVLRCKYESIRQMVDEAVDEASFDFRPYTLLFGQRAWYAIGYHGGRDEVRCMKLNRFTAIALTEKPYMIPEDFSLRGFLGNAWRMIRGDRTYEVELEFDPVFAETIAETRWHETQVVENHPDGSITFRCRVDGLDEIAWWVLGMGPHCLVRRPRELVELVLELARGLVGRYEASEARSSRRDSG